jgi:hypothetical protein
MTTHYVWSNKLRLFIGGAICLNCQATFAEDQVEVSVKRLTLEVDRVSFSCKDCANVWGYDLYQDYTDESEPIEANELIEVHNLLSDPEIDIETITNSKKKS